MYHRGNIQGISDQQDFGHTTNLSQSTAIAPSTIGTFSAIPSSSLNGRTLQVRPLDSKIKALRPRTTIFACESSSEREGLFTCSPEALLVDEITDDITAWIVWSLGTSPSVFHVSNASTSHSLPSSGEEVESTDSQERFPGFLRIELSLVEVAGNMV